MLMERPYEPIGPGTVVHVRSRGCRGTVIGRNQSQWEVEIATGERILVEATDLEQKEILFG